MCDECVSKESAGDDEIEMMPIGEGQIAEMVAAIPGLTRAEILKKFPTNSPKRRKAAVDLMLREAQRRRRSKN